MTEITENIIYMANYIATNNSEDEILRLLKVRNGEPAKSWDEEDLKAFEKIRKAIELALNIKREGNNGIS